MDRATDCQFVSTFHCWTVGGYHAGKQMNLGMKISLLSSISSWFGEGGLDGTASAITSALSSAMDLYSQYISNHLCPASKLTMMASQMDTKAVAFHAKLHAHILKELNKLTQ